MLMGGRLTGAAMTEDDCVICSEWPERDRWALREMTEALPLKDVDQICDECLRVFWRRTAPQSDKPSEH